MPLALSGLLSSIHRANSEHSASLTARPLGMSVHSMFVEKSLRYHTPGHMGGGGGAAGGVHAMS